MSLEVFEKSENLGPTILSKKHNLSRTSDILRKYAKITISKKKLKIKFKFENCISYILTYYITLSLFTYCTSYILYNIIHILLYNIIHILYNTIHI